MKIASGIVHSHAGTSVSVFHVRARTVGDIIDHAVGRLLNLSRVDCDFIGRWTGGAAAVTGPRSGRMPP